MNNGKLFHIFLSFLIVWGPINPVLAQNNPLLPYAGALQQGPAVPFVHLEGLKVNPSNPFQFDFIIHASDPKFSADTLKPLSLQQIKYFLASLTIPEESLWVNLSPREPDRIIDPVFGETALGRDLLLQDYFLKQLSSQILHPDGEVGKQFWDKVHQKALAQYGTTEIPIDMMHKIWIMPDRVDLVESQQGVVIVKASLTVDVKDERLENQSLATAILRRVVLPEIKHMVNHHEQFRGLRQMYRALILATWYKQKFKSSLLHHVYANHQKINGLEINDNRDPQQVYQQYLQLVHEGVFNFIREDIDPHTQTKILKHYFSGGLVFHRLHQYFHYLASTEKRTHGRFETTVDLQPMVVSSGRDNAMAVRRNDHPDPDRNSVYLNPVVENGMLVSGKFVAKYEKSLRRRELMDNTKFVVTNFYLSSTAGVDAFGRQNIWTAEDKKYASKRVQLHFDRGYKLIGVYDEQGRLLEGNYLQQDDPRALGAVWLDAKINNKGHRVGGRFVGSFHGRNVPDEIKNHKNGYVVENINLSASGASNILGDTWWTSLYTHKGAKGTRAHVKGDHRRVFDANGVKIFDSNEIENRVWVNYSVHPKTGVVSGDEVGGFPAGISESIFKGYDDFVITHVSLNAQGGLSYQGKSVFTSTSGYEGYSKAVVYVKKGKVVKVTDQQGRKIIYGEKNRIYINASIDEQGKRVGGDFLKSVQKINNYDELKKHNKVMIENFPVSVLGNAPGILWKGESIRKGAFLKPVTVGEGLLLELDEEADIRRAFNQQGELVYDKDGDIKNRVYKNASVRYGKREGGDLIRAGSALTKKTFNEKGEFVVENFYPNSDGRVFFNTQHLPIGKTKLGPKENLTLVVENKKPTELYRSSDGLLLYTTKDNLKVNTLRAPVSDGTWRSRGLFSRANMEHPFGYYSEGLPGDWLKKDSDVVLTDVKLNAQGQLVDRDGHAYWDPHPEFANQDGVTVYAQGGVVTYAFTEDKRFIVNQDERKFQVYKDAEVQFGKRKGGVLLASSNKSSPKVYKGKGRFVIEGSFANRDGRVFLGTQHLPTGKTEVDAEEKLTLVIEDEKPVELYRASDGLLLYTTKDNLKVNALRSIKSGRVAFFNRASAYTFGYYPEGIPVGLFESKEGFALTAVMLNERGQLEGRDGRVWSKENVDFANEQRATVYIQNGSVSHIFTEDKRLVVGEEKRRQGVKLDEDKKLKDVGLDGINLFHEGAGYDYDLNRIVGGTYLGQVPRDDEQEFMKKHPDGVVSNIVLNSSSSLYFAGKNYHTKGDPDSTDNIAICREGGIVRMIDRQGRIIYDRVDEFGQSTEELFQVEQILNEEDIEGLIRQFGLTGAFRILLRMYEVSPKTLKNLLRKKVQSNPKLNSESGGQLNRDLSFVRMRQNKSLSSGNRQKFQAVVQEMITLVYRQITEEGSAFLKRLKEQGNNPANSLFMRKVYKQVHAYYASVNRYRVRGIDEDEVRLRLYQRLGVKFLTGHSRAILADEPGLGKTIQAIAASLNINKGRGANKVLVIAPKSSLRSVWKDQIESFTSNQEKAFVLPLGSRFSPKHQRDLRDSRFVVVSWDAIKGKNNKRREKLKSMGFDVVIADEAHRMKNESLRTEAIRELNAPYQWLLSGTPLDGSGIHKMLNLMNWLNPEDFPSLKDVDEKEYMRPEKVQEMMDKIRPYMLRREKSTVSDLPPKKIIYMPFDLNMDERKNYEETKNDFKHVSEEEGFNSKVNLAFVRFARLRQSAVSSELPFNKLVFKSLQEEVVVSSRQPKVILNGKTFNVLRQRGHIVGLSQSGKKYFFGVEDGDIVVVLHGVKYHVTLPVRNFESSRIDVADQLVDEIMKREEKVIINVNHTEIAHSLAERYKKRGVSVLAGPLSQSNIASTVDDFQKNPEKRVFITTYAHGSEAINLSSANNVIEFEKPNSLRFRLQSNDRPHRFGQTKPVTVYRLTARDTVDVRYEQILRQQEDLFRFLFLEENIGQDITAQVMREELTKNNVSEDFINRVLASIDESKVKEEYDFLIQEGEQSISWKKGVFKARLNTNDGVENYYSLGRLIKEIDSLTPVAKKMFVEFVKQTIQQEIRQKVSLKKTFYWKLIQEIMPRLNGVDFYKELFDRVELSMHIVNVLIHSPNTTVEQLFEITHNRLLVNDILRFMDTEGVFKALSLLGVLPPARYFAQGRLLSYENDIAEFFDEGRVFYRDEKAVHAIAPDPYQEISGAVTDPLKRVAATYRKFSKEEEEGLAREVRRGNVVAEDFLVGAKTKWVLRLVERSINGAKSRLGRGRGMVDFYQLREGVFNVALQETYRLLRRFVRQDDQKLKFETYVEKILIRSINKYLYQEINALMKEQTTLDASIQNDQVGSATGVDFLTETAQSLGDEEDVLISQTGEFLRAQLYASQEIEAFLSLVVDGLSVEEVAMALDINEQHVKEVFNDAKSLLVKQQELRDGWQQRGVSFQEDGAMVSAMDKVSISEYGGVDFNPRHIDFNINKPFEVSCQDEEEQDCQPFYFDAASVQNFMRTLQGFEPRIIHFRPLEGVSVFLEG